MTFCINNIPIIFLTTKWKIQFVMSVEWTSVVVCSCVTPVVVIES